MTVLNLPVNCLEYFIHIKALMNIHMYIQMNNTHIQIQGKYRHVIHFITLYWKWRWSPQNCRVHSYSLCTQPWTCRWSVPVTVVHHCSLHETQSHLQNTIKICNGKYMCSYWYDLNNTLESETCVLWSVKQYTIVTAIMLYPDAVVAFLKHIWNANL